VAAKFSEAIAEHGPDSVAFYVSGQLLTEDYYVANKLMKGFIGSANIDTNSRLCMSSSVAGHRRAFGADTVPGTYEDLELADLIILVGSNLAWCHPVLYQRMAAGCQANAAADEDRGHRSAPLDDSADLADLHLAIRPIATWRCSIGLFAHLASSPASIRIMSRNTPTGFHDALAKRAEPHHQRRLAKPACRRNCANSTGCSRRRKRWSPATARASTSRRSAPTRSMRSSIAISPPAASASPAWDRSR
jgi:assimilatory nitrate reductase catalytic subunit